MCKSINCRVSFKDDNVEENVTIIVGTTKPVCNDDNIFYYCSDMKEFNALIGNESKEDFYIVEVYEI